MIKWLNKLSSPLSAESSGKTDREGSSSRLKWTSAYASDPTEWERIFETKWKCVEAILETKLNNIEHDVDYDEMTNLLDNVTCMCALLMLEVNSQPEPLIGPILDRFFTEQILEKTLDWAIQLPALLKPSCELALVRIYENIVSESHSQNHCILVHKPILNPLLRLCEWSRRVANYWSFKEDFAKNELSATDKHFVLLLNQICTKLAEDRTLLHFFFSCVNGCEQFIVFTQLITFLYESSDVGQLAKDAVLLILSVSSENEQIAKFVSKKTAFCPVVATGLSGCFSQLPRSILGDGGERLMEDQYSDSLSDFHSALLFCNAVAQNAHSVVVEEIAQYFYSGFLISVVKPALLQDDREFIAASLAYLHLCVETILEPLLLKSIVRMLLTERDENNVLLFERIIQYTRGGDKTAVVAVGVIEAFVGLCCEDVMLAFVFRPLLTNHIVNKNKLSRVYNRLRCEELSQKYLDCIPKCVLQYSEICSGKMLEIYMKESKFRIDARSEQCRAWKWKYDGVVENGFCLPAESDDDATCHVPFSRLSSSRSSMSIAMYGLNRYTRASSHLSHDFNIEKVCGLGERQASDEDPAYGSDFEREDEIEEDSDFVLPPIDEMAVSKAMTSSCIDYLHISAIDDFSESDESSKKMSKQSFDGDTDSDKSKGAFVLSGWRDVKDESTWRSLLDKQKIKGDMLEGKDIIDFMEKKMAVLMAEEKEVEETETAENPVRNVKKTGFSVYNFPERSTLLKTLFEGIETLCENSLPFNIELISLLTTLACFPQSILAYYLFEPKEEKSEKSLLSILQGVQTRIEIMSDGIEGIDGWIGKALKSLEVRKARMNRHVLENRRQCDEDASIPFIGRAFGASIRRAANFRMHTHKHMEKSESNREDSTAKQTALAAIFLAHLSQILATIVLQQSLIK